jgi:hypothetical protein
MFCSLSSTPVPAWPKMFVRTCSSHSSRLRRRERGLGWVCLLFTALFVRRPRFSRKHPGEGSTFEILLPAVDESSTLQDTRHVSEPEQAETEAILVVDDVKEVRAFAALDTPC